MQELEKLNNITTQTRRDILRMVHKVNSGHPGGSLGCAEFLVTLFNSVMKRNDDFSMDGINEDIFFLSNGHISPVFYSVLARCGYFDVDELNTFRLINSRLQGHPTTHEGLPWSLDVVITMSSNIRIEVCSELHVNDDMIDKDGFLNLCKARIIMIN